MNIYISDIEESLDEIISIEKLSGKSVFITGATGLICSSVVEMLLSINDRFDYGIRVYAAGRNSYKLNKRFKKYIGRDDLILFSYDALKDFELPQDIDYIIHGAGNASPQKYMEEPVETMLANVIGVKNLLEQAKGRECRVLYISSSEVYGKKNNSEPYSEVDYGTVDISKIRACYPTSKRAAEVLCLSYASEYKLDVVIARPGHIYGPTAEKDDLRVSSVFPREILRGKNIVMKSSGMQLRSYCYVVDCATAILTILLNGKNLEAYNISNKNSLVTIREMAAAFAKAGEKIIEFEHATENEVASYNLMENSSLQGEKLEKLGWKGKFDIHTGTMHTLLAMREVENE